MSPMELTPAEEEAWQANQDPLIKADEELASILQQQEFGQRLSGRQNSDWPDDEGSLKFLLEQLSGQTPKSWQALPEELKFGIFSQISNYKDFFKLRGFNKESRRLLEDPRLLKHFITQFIQDQPDNAKQLFLHMIRKGNINYIQAFLNAGIDANIIDMQSTVPIIGKMFRPHTALTLAESKGHDDAVALLIAWGADITDYIKDKSKAEKQFFKAVANNNKKALEALIGAGFNNVNIKLHNNSSALLLATAQGHIELVELLLDKGADVNAKDKDGLTSLMVSISNGSIEIVQLLLARGADVNLIDDEGTTALIRAAQKGNSKIVQLLLDNNANVNAQNNKGTTALIAAAHQKKGIVKLLLGYKADVNTTDKSGNTALMRAINLGTIDTVRVLLEKGASVNVQNNEGLTAIMFAAVKGDALILQLLLDYHADVQIEATEGLTALFCASLNGRKEATKLLLNNKANPNASVKGITPLMIAVERGEDDLVTYLFEREADVNAQADDGRTALTIARERNNDKIIGQLLRYGANEISSKRKSEQFLTMVAVACALGYVTASMAIKRLIDFIRREDT